MENRMSVATFKKIAVVTGASSGIGAVYADRLAARGYDLILVARRADRLEALSKKILKTYAGAKIEVIAADLTKESDLVRVEKVLATNPAVRILVNNAGLARLAAIAQAPVQQSLAQIALNITSVTRLTHAVLPALLSRNDGVIVNIASVLAIHSLPISSVYSGTKAFVLNFTRPSGRTGRDWRKGPGGPSRLDSNRNLGCIWPSAISLGPGHRDVGRESGGRRPLRPRQG